MTATKTIRISADLAEMLAAIGRHNSARPHRLLDPLIRERIESMFSALPETDRKYTKSRIARLKAVSNS